MRVIRRSLIAIAVAAVVAVLAQAQPFRGGSSADFEYATRPEAEFHFARLAYATSRYAGSRGVANPMWAVDWPLAEQHFVPAFTRYTRAETAPESAIVKLDSDIIFQFPWLLIQQVYAGQWSPTRAEAEQLREYLMRGGFVLFDDFHGQEEWRYFESLMSVILPDRRIVDIPKDDAIMNILFPLDQSVQIPGDRHLYRGLEGPTTWRGIYDDEDRLMVGIAFNADMGDAWEHADDPDYPAEMTGQAYRFGTNFVVYAMTH
jgi:hypothetical protein